MAISVAAHAQERVKDDAHIVRDQIASEAHRTGPSTVRVSANPDGRTPALIGYNLGMYDPGNNVSAWLRYNEINAVRHWWSGKSWPAIPSLWTQSDNTLAHFESARAALRSAPADDLVELAKAIIADQGTLPTRTIGLSHQLSELKKNGITTLIQLNHENKKYPFELADGSPNWHGRWSYWRGVYLIARYLATTYGIERFQLFNEPDHGLKKNMDQAEYLRRHQVGADALQAAFADLNRTAAKKSSLRLSGPVSAGLLVFEKRAGRPDTRDVETGWGELITLHRHDEFPGRSEAFESLYNVYSFQNYGRDPERMLTGIPRLRSLIARGNGGQELPLIVTEMNVSTAANFRKTPKTLDDPTYYASLGVVSSAYVNAGIDEIYFFRHTQQPITGESPKKNGTHIVGLEDPMQNIVASTRGGEAARLFTKGFKGARVRLTPPALDGGMLYASACMDEADSTHYLLISYFGDTADTIQVDLSPWNLPAGSLVTLEEVNMTHHGDITDARPLPSDGQVKLSVPGPSVMLLSIRSALSGIPHVIQPVTTESRPGLLSAAHPEEARSAGRVLLAVRANPISTNGRLLVRAGSGDPVQAEVLGQFLPTNDAAERVVDVTRHVLANPNGPLVFQIVAEGSAASLGGDVPAPATVRSAELRMYGAR